MATPADGAPKMVILTCSECQTRFERIAQGARKHRCPACRRVHRRDLVRVQSWRYRALHQERERLRAKRAYTPEKQARQKELRDPRKESARRILRNAVAAGKIEKPVMCEGCHLIPGRPLHGHHEDYAKPLVVRWLCSICHGLEHRHAALSSAPAGTQQSHEHEWYAEYEDQDRCDCGARRKIAPAGMQEESNG